MDPAVVDSAEFGLLWKYPFLDKEQFYAKPLTYTPTGMNQIVFLASSQNWIRILDAKSGTLIKERQVNTPFLQSDIGCTDIPNTIGITGTPVIDPNTDTAYFFAKTYIPNLRLPGNTGTYNGVYYFHAVDVRTLEERPGYPILVDGSVSDNDDRKYFVGGTILQRASLIQLGSYVYGGFGGHCDLFNYTGTVVGVNVASGKIAANWVTMSGPNSNFGGNWNQNGGGGLAGIWMAGMSLSTDSGSRLFFSTGNGAGQGENRGTPASGQSGLRTLGEAVISVGIDQSTGKLSLIDYFQPFDYINMDGGDQDFGSGGVALLDPTVFKGAGVTQIAITTGKNGKIYFMNGNDLGGYKQGPGQTDKIVQTIVTNQAVFGGVGSYPLEGGYIYSTPVGNPTSVYKLGFTGAGVPQFSFAGATKELSAGRVGPGTPTLTSFKGQPGTGIMWLTDPDAGLRAWYAVPQADGSLKRIKLPQTGGSNKFQRPAFGDTRLYTTDANGILYCLGSPVNLPLDCTSPVSFGSVALGSKSEPEKVVCTALINVNQISSISVSDLHFVIDPITVPKGAIAKGQTFSLGVTWDLTNTTVSNAVNASYGNITPGVKSAALTISTVNGVAGYTTNFPVSLTGTQVSQKPFLQLTPQTVDFGGLVLGIPGDENPTAQLSFTLANLGQGDLTVLGYAYSTKIGEDDDDDDGGGADDFTNITSTNGVWDLGPGFTTANLPAIGSKLTAGQSLQIPATFSPTTGVGSYLSYFNMWSDGGNKLIILEGSASTAPRANFSISTSEGGWLPEANLIMDFGVVAPGDTAQRQIRICNEGGSVLTVTKSKPPLGTIRALNYGIDLHESQAIGIGECAFGVVVFQPQPSVPNLPDQIVTNEWTLNVDDLDFGVHVVEMRGTVHTKQIGPLYPNGTARYQYLGCYKDNVAGRLLPNQLYTDVQANTNQKCQTAGANSNMAFVGTEYQQECWAGNKLPSGLYYTLESDRACTFACTGDASQSCGGGADTGYISIYYDTTKYTITDQTFNATSPGGGGGGGSVGGPITANSSGPYDYIGCYSEGSNGRALTGAGIAPPEDGGSVEYCQSKCSGYQYFGVEYSNECYCGNTIQTGSTLVPGATPADTSCNMLCGGNSSEYCGGPNRLNMYKLNSTITLPPTPAGPGNVPVIGKYTYAGCYSEATTSRALTGFIPPVPAGNGSVDWCYDKIVGGGWKWFGVEYGGECYAGNDLQAGSVLVQGDAATSGCSMTCAGNSSQYCGGPNRLSMYVLNGTQT
ncbi:WSC domain-containing protein 3 [Elsinoe fawcettii]|nr:WSC domain-containing protein 3 [Elsinoe fawcettii]